jgi:hypothetical protein
LRALSAPQPNAQRLFNNLGGGEYTTAIPGVSRAGEAMFAKSLRWSVPAFRKNASRKSMGKNFNDLRL